MIIKFYKILNIPKNVAIVKIYEMISLRFDVNNLVSVPLLRS